ncbi:P-loop NTPase family protein [Desulforegula conservatrix]|uniref:hypothetical protein n=1 Tax=Desulforegula conservatrix TaxID=153026 RepID=UPI0003F97141|nr:hypothetical protein [Desulforegula conservatrix]
MAYKKALLILACFLLTALSASKHLHAKTAHTEPRPCPSEATLFSEMELKRQDLLKIEAGLSELIKSGAGGNASPAALFVTDLNDNEAIAQKVEELEKQQKEGKKPDYTSDYGTDQAYFNKCTSGNKNAEIKANELADLNFSIDSLRLKFLSLPETERKRLLETKKELSSQKELLEYLKNQKNEALDQKEQANKSLQEAEQKAINENNRLLRDIASERAILEKTKSDIADIQAKSASEMEKQTYLYHETEEKLAEIEAALSAEQDQESLKKSYNDILSIWRMLVDSTFKNSGASFYTSNISKLPDIPSYPSSLLKRAEKTEEAENYIKSYNEAQNLRADLLLKGKQRLDENMALHYRLMIKAGKIRSTLLNIARNEGYIRLDKVLTERHISDIFREAKLVPYRWIAIFYVKIVDVKHNLMSGIKGWIQLAENIIFFMLFLTIPIFYWLMMKKITAYINQSIIRLHFQRFEDPGAGSMSTFLKTSTPYLPWAGTIIAVTVAKSITKNTVFSEIEILLPYISLYCCYRIFRLFFKAAVSMAIVQSKLGSELEKPEKIEESVRSTGLVIFISLSILYAIESMISMGIIYVLAVRMILICSAAVIIWVISGWRKELSGAIRSKYKNRILLLMASGLEGRFSLLWSIPAFFFFSLLIAFYWFKLLSERFETYKIISATIFRKKLENITKENEKTKTELPEEYAKMFTFKVPDDPDILISPEDDLLKDLLESVEDWIKGSSKGHSVAIYGDKGSGKSCLMWRLANSVQGVRIIKISIPPKMTDSKSILNFFGQYFGHETIDGDSIIKNNDEGSGKTLFMIDETQNLFLGTVGGFDGFKAFLDLVNSDDLDVYWCLGFNRYAWIYIYNVLGKRPYINEARRMRPWTDKDIKTMIEKRHSKTDFRISYEKIIKASGNVSRLESMAQAESDFFRLIWQQSGGNPRISIHIWLSALIFIPPYTLEAGLPARPDISGISGLPEDSLFIYSEILKHENLTLEETILSSNLPIGVVTHALRLGIKKKFLEQSDDGRYRISIFFQNTLINHLKGRNFIYEQ